MKIKINEYETYELNLPDEISPQEFFAFVGRVNHIQKLIGKDPLINVSQSTQFVKRYYKRGNRPWSNSREEALKVCRLHYKGSKLDKLKYAEVVGIDWSDINKRVFSIRKKWNITPEEVGLTRFPMKHENRFNELVIKDFDNENGTEIKKEK